MAETTVLTTLVALTGVFGVLIGSFLNVVVHRVPVGASVVAPASRCPDCGTSISPIDNVPVASWLLLRGRCRHCRAPISVVYPLVELGTGLVFAGVAIVVLPAILDATSAGEVVASVSRALSLLWLAGASIALSVIDLQTHRLPNAIVYPTIVVAAVAAALVAIGEADLEVFARALASGGILFGVYLLLGLLWAGGMGLGDIKLAAALGIYLGTIGWGALMVGAFAAFVLGGIVSVILVAFRVVKRSSGIPFGPWMLAGAWVGILAGESIFTAYVLFVGLG